MTPDVPFDPPRRTHRLRGRTFSYTDTGEGPVVVLVHGLPGSVRDYRWLGSALRDTPVRLLRLDMPGFGETDKALAPGLSLEARARFVVDASQALDLERITLVGHSMGGPVALAAAALDPALTRALVLLASVGLTPHRAFRAMPAPRFTAPLLASRFSRRFLVGPLHDAFVHIGFPASTPTEDLFVTMETIGALRFAHIRHFAAALAETDIRVALATADDDRLVEPAIGEALAERLGGTLHRYATGGHNLQKTRAVEVAELVAGLAQ